MIEVKTIHHLERLRGSVYGNPRYEIYFTDYSHATSMSDAAFCYGITNAEYRDVPVVVEYTRAGRIRNITPVSKKGATE